MKLTEFDLRVYGYLELYYNTDNKFWVREWDLYDTLGFENPSLKYIPRDKFHDSKERLRITKSIQRLNNSLSIDRIIISSKRGVKIANEDEVKKYVGSKIKQAVASLNRAKKCFKKANSNGQFKLVRKNGKYTIEEIKTYES